MARTTGPTHKLKDVKLNEISFVGKGDNPEAHVLLLKRKPNTKQSITKLGKEYTGTGEQVVALAKWLEGAKEILKDAATFQQLIDNKDIKDKVWGMVYTLEDSIYSIMNDGECTDKAAMIQQSVDEFKNVITTLTKEATDMPEKVVKELEAKVTGLEKEKVDLQAEIATLKTAPKTGDKCPTCGVTKEAPKDEIDKSALPEAVRKRLEDQDAEIEKNRKETEVLKEAELTREYIGKAAEIGAVGKVDEVGDLLKSVAKVSKELAGKVFDVLKAADARIKTGGLFKEIGTDAGGDATASASEKITQKAAELRKTCPELTKEQAWTKVYDTDADLRKEYIAERKR